MTKHTIFNYGPLMVAALAAMTLAACGGGGSGEEKPTFKPLEMNIGHINDHHSHLEDMNFDLKFDGVKTRVRLGGFPRVTQWYKDQEEAGTKNFLKLHAGDALTGTEYFSFYKGKADAALMNTVCFDAMAVGNHEFDESDSLLRDFMGHLWTPECQTPVLTANVKPALGTPLMLTADLSYIKPYIIKEIDGVKVGIVGLTISGKTQKSSQPLETTVFEDEAAAAQRAVDALQVQGIEHIILLTHQGIAKDLEVAQAVTGVDVVVGGDSHTLVGDFSNVGIDTKYANYPTMTTNKDGDQVCVVQAWEYTKTVGLLNVKFNDKGAIESCSGQPKLLIGGDSFLRKNAEGDRVEVDAATKQKLLTAIEAMPNVEVYEEDSDAVTALKFYKDQNEEFLEQTIGSTQSSLCLTRIPGTGDGRSEGTAGCEGSDKVAKGSDVAQVVAESFLVAAKRAQIALQNGGGVRTPIAAGEITNKAAYALLPFSNTLVEMEMTGQEIINALEDAVDNHLAQGGSSGSHPYAAALRWDLDMSKAKGQRFINLEVKDKATGAWSALDKTKTYVVVTNDYIAGGRDGYTTLGEVTEAGKVVDTYLLYTQSFIDYVTAKGTIDLPARSDYSHKSVIGKDGVEVPETVEVQ